MRTLDLSGRDRRALRIGLLLIAPILVWSLVVRPYAAHLADLNTAIGRERDLLSRERAVLALADAYPARMAMLNNASSAQRAAAFAAPDPAAAAASFSTWAADLAYRSSVRVDRVSAREPQGGAAGTELRFSIDASSDIGGMVRWLGALERGPRHAVVERLVVRPSADGALEITLDLLGFAVATEPPTETER